MEFTTQWKDYNACLEIKLKLTHRIKTMFCLLCNISQRWSNKQAIFVELCMANGFISSNEILDVGNAGAWWCVEWIILEIIFSRYWDSHVWQNYTFQNAWSYSWSCTICCEGEGCCCISNDNGVTILPEKKIHHLSNYKWNCHGTGMKSENYKNMLRRFLKCFSLLPNNFRIWVWMDIKVLISHNGCQSYSQLFNLFKVVRLRKLLTTSSVGETTFSKGATDK